MEAVGLVFTNIIFLVAGCQTPVVVGCQTEKCSPCGLPYAVLEDVMSYEDDATRNAKMAAGLVGLMLQAFTMMAYCLILLHFTNKIAFAIVCAVVGLIVIGCIIAVVLDLNNERLNDKRKREAPGDANPYDPNDEASPGNTPRDHV
jgi:tetrahydromethanopterin S-methyltransferase subunit E